MRILYLAAAGWIACCVLSPHTAAADDTLAAVKDAVAALQTQMQQMKAAYEGQINALLARIENLEQEKQGKEGQASAAKAAVTEQPPPAAKAAMPATLPPAQPAAAQAAGGASAPLPPTLPETLPPTKPAAQPPGPYAPGYRGPGVRTQMPPSAANAFNPGIAGVLNGTFGSYSRDPDTALVPGFQLGDETGIGPRGFSLGESEVALAANIDPYLYGSMTISLDSDNEVSVEEAYIQTTGLPWGFTARAGRFFSGIGYLNERHAHDWDFIDAPLPYRAFLNTQYGDDGVQLRWLAPTDIFLELAGEVFRGDSFPAANAPGNGAGTFSVFARMGDDIDESSSWLAGLSFLQTRAGERMDGGGTFNGRGNTGIGSLVYKWAPDGNPYERNLIVNGEYFFGNEDGRFNGNPIDQWRDGWYLQGVYQFMPRWRVGLRHDQAAAEDVSGPLLGTAVDSQGHTPSNNSLLLEYDTSEFGRFRLQYNRDDADFETNNEIIAGYTAIFGPHGAHRF